MIDEAAIRIQLQNHHISYLGGDLVTAKAIKSIVIDGSRVKVDVLLGFPALTVKDQLIKQIKSVLTTLPKVQDVEVDLSWQIQTHSVQTGLQELPGVKNIIAVASGKGGVGKSTTAVNLAIALSQEGAAVGILDADIYGPNQPHMLGAQTKPETHSKKLVPITLHGVQSMSIGYLIDVKTPMVWRGPMVTAALQQLLRDTQWGNLDYLIIDLPPGTGDIQLTLAQRVPVSGAVIVTTPQDLALLDAQKGLEMFRKVRVAVLGIIENMSTHVCSHCGHQEALFGEGGGSQLSQAYDAPLLGKLPLAMEIREAVDRGVPTMAADPKNPLSLKYRDIALSMAAQLSLQGMNHGIKFPQIVVEDEKDED